LTTCSQPRCVIYLSKIFNIIIVHCRIFCRICIYNLLTGTYLLFGLISACLFIFGSFRFFILFRWWVVIIQLWCTFCFIRLKRSRTFQNTDHPRYNLCSFCMLAISVILVDESSVVPQLCYVNLHISQKSEECPLKSPFKRRMIFEALIFVVPCDMTAVHLFSVTFFYLNLFIFIYCSFTYCEKVVSKLILISM